MHNADRKLIYLLWTVIAALVVGLVIGGFIIIRHVNNLEQVNTNVGGDNDSLKRQVQQLKAAAAATPTPTATPLATPEPSAAPAPAPTPKKR